MATMEAALVSLLTTGSPNPVSDIVGTRVYPDVLPQGVTYPAIRYARISTPRYRDFSGPAGRARPRFQIDCYGTGKADVLSLAAAVRAVLDGYAGTSATVRIDASAAEDEGGSYEDDVEVYRERIDFIFSHTE